MHKGVERHREIMRRRWRGGKEKDVGIKKVECACGLSDVTVLINVDLERILRYL